MGQSESGGEGANHKGETPGSTSLPARACASLRRATKRSRKVDRRDLAINLGHRAGGRNGRFFRGSRRKLPDRYPARVPVAQPVPGGASVATVFRGTDRDGRGQPCRTAL